MFTFNAGTMTTRLVAVPLCLPPSAPHDTTRRESRFSSPAAITINASQLSQGGSTSFETLQHLSWRLVHLMWLEIARIIISGLEPSEAKFPMMLPRGDGCSRHSSCGTSVWHARGTFQVTHGRAPPKWTSSLANSVRS